VIGDISLSKNGGTLTALASAATLTYIANGQYTLALTTGNTDTLGTARVLCNKSTYQMPTLELMVLPATVYDALTTNATNATGGLATATGSISALAGAISTLTGAQAATAVWQDTTSGDFTVSSSIGKSLYTSGVVPGGSGGLFISGSNTGTTTVGALTCTGSFTVSDGLLISRSTSNTSAITATGNGTGSGAVFTSGSGATGDGFKATAASTNGNGFTLTKAGSGSDFNATSTPLTLAKTTNITGFNDIAATAIVSSGAITTSGGAVSTVTTVTNQLTAAQIATGVWQDATAGDFTVSSSIGKSLYTSGAAPGAAGGLFIAGTNAATTITTSLTTTFTGNLTGSVGSVSGAVGSVTGAVGSVTGDVGGNVTGSIGSVATGGITAASIADGAIDRATFAADTGLQSIRSNTAQAGASTSITLDASASSVTSFYVNDLIVLTGGTGVGQGRYITAYNGTTKVATVSAWATNPDATTTFAIIAADAIVGATAPTAAQVATAVWTDLTSGSDFSTATSVGKLLKDNIDATISSRLAPTTSGRTLDVTTTGAAGIDWGNMENQGATVDLNATSLNTVNTVLSVQNAVDVTPSSVSAIQNGLATPTNITAGTITTATNVTTVNGLAANVITAASIATDAGTEIANAVLAGGDVDGYSLEQTLKLCLAALAGKLSGAATTTVTIRAADDSKNRLTATVDSDGNRSAVTYDATG